MDYKSKIITVGQALALVKPNDVIISGLASAEPRAFLSELHTIAERVSNVTVTTCLPMIDAEYFLNPEYRESFNMAGWFYTAPMRKAHKNGNISFIPNHLHLASRKRLYHQKPNIFIGNATLLDKHGYISLSLSNVYEKRMLTAADLVILEINPKLPRTFGDLEVHINDVDYLIEVDYDIPELPDVTPNAKDLQIGQAVADLINDGDCIQLGIGGIPNAVAASLMSKKHLGIHTEMFTTGMMKLMRAGVITNKKKTL
ncbi:MAG: 4-hydroxybutyrate--acetyl-CoA CoA transferase, partial [Bacillota bacterium]|nr:4-hydroxybutyrate--acetyl-CoA CoA transferase [Bacillota bacterium]